MVHQSLFLCWELSITASLNLSFSWWPHFYQDQLSWIKLCISRFCQHYRFLKKSILHVQVFLCRFYFSQVFSFMSPFFPVQLLHFSALPTNLYFKKIFNVYLFLREKETEREQGRGTEKGRHRIRSRRQAQSCQHRARREARTHKPRDHDLSRCWMPNWLSHPSAPINLYSLVSHLWWISWCTNCFQFHFALVISTNNIYW